MSKVIIYTSEGCRYCHAAKEFFNENNIPYTEYNITKDKEARKELMKKGIMSVPYIIIDGNEVLGFDSYKIKSLLNI